MTLAKNQPFSSTELEKDERKLRMGLRADLKRFVTLLRRLLLSEYFILYLLIAYFIVLAWQLPTIAKPANLVNVLANTWPLLAVAVGQTVVLIVKGIDLSQGSNIAFTSVVGAVLMATAASESVLSNSPLWGNLLDEHGGILANQPNAVLIGCLVMIAVGALIGLINGFAIARFNMPAFMVTLVALMFFSAFAIYLTQSENVRNLPDGYVELGKGEVISFYFGEKAEPQIPRKQIYSFVTYAMFISLALTAVVHIILSRTVLGKHIYALGTNRRAAQVSGVPVARTIIAAYMISGVCAAIGAILYSARLEAGRPTLGAGTFLLDVIGATVIGGTSLNGGKGKVTWTIMGVLFFVLLSNSLNLLHLSAFYIDMVKGSVILAAAVVDVIRTRLAASEAVAV